MSKRKSGQVVLIVDDDIGFVMWLGQALANGGLIAFPALSGEEALARIRDLKLTPILAIVNTKLSGSKKLIRAIQSKTKIFPIDAPGDTSADKWVARVKGAIAGK